MRRCRKNIAVLWINRGNATASEIMELIQEVQKRVYEQSGVRLEPEVKLLGF